ncbi:hypothetical protein MW887_008660 [Aspergillus wentii]|nr:hypothetical protein MW887_008660 [Aspergillus wentii]
MELSVTSRDPPAIRRDIEIRGARFPNVILDITEKSLIAVLELPKALANSMVKMLDGPIDITIRSTVYKKVAGAEMSVLDLVCLVAAILANVIFKMATNRELFPDNANMNALITAKDFETLKNLLTDDVGLGATLVSELFSTLGVFTSKEILSPEIADPIFSAAIVLLAIGLKAATGGVIAAGN